jgi:hypothetical protein
MARSFVLLCSAVVLRVAGGLATVAGVQSEWFDPVASWACWLLPLTAYECAIRRSHLHLRPITPRIATSAAPHGEPIAP